MSLGSLWNATCSVGYVPGVEEVKVTVNFSFQRVVTNFFRLDQYQRA